MVTDGSRTVVERFGETGYDIGDGRIGHHRNLHLTVKAAGRRGQRPVRQRITEELPRDDTTDHDHDGHQRNDHQRADAAPSRVDHPVTAGPFTVEAVPTRGSRRRRLSRQPNGVVRERRRRTGEIPVIVGHLVIGVIVWCVVEFSVAGGTGIGSGIGLFGIGDAVSAHNDCRV